jgi:hypothetical protein
MRYRKRDACLIVETSVRHGGEPRRVRKEKVYTLHLVLVIYPVRRYQTERRDIY